MKNETLPAYQNRLNELNSAADQALTAYNQAENTYQMAFTAWSADQSPENTEALSQAEADRSNAQVEYQNAGLFVRGLNFRCRRRLFYLTLQALLIW